LTYIGKTPTPVPLTSSDITNGIVSVDKLTSTLDLSSNTVTLPSGVGGKVLQVVNATSTAETVKSDSSTSDTGLTANITPALSSNKVLAFAHIQGVGKNGDGYVTLKLVRGSTDLATFEQRGGDTDTSNTNKVGGCSITFLDSPSSTSATTYKVTVTGNGNSYAQVGDSNPTHTITLMEISA
tara:strand:+ start:1186 stop:1731 length:546 start_codon:yes stop_codon:yes gene_type:complete